MPDNDQEWEPVLGFASDDVEAELEALPAATSGLSSGSLNDIDLTIVGFEIVPGGEVREGNDGKDYTTKDTLVIHNRVDDPDLADDIPFTRDFLSLPKRGRSGKRSSPSLGSKYGIALAALEDLGISSDPQLATQFQMATFRDLMGLRYHRLSQTVDGYAGPVTGNGASAVYGFDNEHRKAVGLDPAYLKSERRPPVVARPAVRPVPAAATRVRARPPEPNPEAEQEGP